MAVYVPDEKGELTALDHIAVAATDMPPMMPGDLGASVGKMLIALIAVVALLFISYWFLRKFVQGRLQRGNSDASIQILEKRMLSPKTMLYLIEVEGKRVLIAESHLEIKRLETITETVQ